MMRSPCSLSRMHAACRVTTCASSASVNDFAPALEEGTWIHRLGGLVPNAVALEKETVCPQDHLEDGDPVELGLQMGALARRFPHINVWGGCCGTDARQLREICKAVTEARSDGGAVESV